MQKTAYEMRISDLSSDVCSSGLQAAMAAQSRRLVARGGDLRHLLQPHAVHRHDIARRVEADVQHGLRHGLGAGKGQRSHVARHIIPVLRSEERLGVKEWFST